MKLRNLFFASMAMMALGVSAQTAVTPASGTANPFAYALTSTAEDGVIKMKYSLNADASAVAIIVKNAETGEVINTLNVTGDHLKKGTHSASVNLLGQPTGTYTWEVKVTGAAKTTVETFASYQFFHPRGVDIDNNIESDYFGNIYVTEGIVSTNTKYHSTSNGGLGLYAFDAAVTPIKNNKTGKYAFNGGLSLDPVVAGPNGSNTNGADFCRVRVDKTGKIYVTRQNDNGNYLYAADASTLLNENKLSAVFTGGSLDASTYAYQNSNGDFIAAPNQGFDIKGEGSDFKMVMISGQKNIFPASYNSKATRVDEYALGTAKTWSSTPTSVSALSGKYVASYASVNATYDNRGGIWFSQMRTTPTNTLPALIYVDANGNQKYFEGDGGKYRGGGGFRFNTDFTQVAIASSKTTFSIYDITYASDNTPTLKEVYTITHGIGTNVNDIAWDRANNIYICGNSGEWFKCFSIPRANNEFTTKVASKYAVSYEAPVVEVPALYTDPVAEAFPEATIDDVNLGKVAEIQIAELEGKTVRAAELRGENLYVLALDAENAPYVYVVNTTTNAVTAVSTEGLVAEGQEGGLALSDLAVTSDGYLMACNYVFTVFQNTSYPEIKVYTWENDENGLPTGTASKWWGYQAPARYAAGWTGATMAFTGARDNGTALLTAARANGASDATKSGHLRFVGVSKIAGDIVKNDGNLTFISYNVAQGNVHTEDVYGTEYQFSVSPLNEENFIMDGSIAQAKEILLDGNNSTNCSVNATLVDGVADAAVTNAGYFKYAGKSLMVVPANGAINVIDITNGFDKATQALSVEAEAANTDMFVAGRGIAGEAAEMQLVTLNGNTLTLYGQVEPVAPLYITGANVGGNWNPGEPAEFTHDGTNYTIVLDETASEFKISTAKGSWDEFNAGNLAVDAALTNGGKVNLSVNKDGGNIVLPWAGVWTITVAGDLSTLTATTETPKPDNFPAAIYMVGHNGAWDPANPLEIAGEYGVYTMEGVEFTNAEFKLSTSKGDWNAFNANCYDATSTITIGEAATLKKGDQNIKIAATGTYDVTIDLENMTITLVGKVEYPEVIYAIGNVNGYEWSTSEGVALSHTENGVYEGEFEVDNADNGFGYFQFATTLGADWAAVNAAPRYGATENNQLIEANSVYNMTNNWAGGTQSWKSEAGTCKVQVDIVNCTMQILEFTGVEGVEVNENAPVEYYNLQGVKVENPENGTFIKVQGKKTTKVYIK